MSRQHTCVPMEQLQDGPMAIEFDFLRTAFGTDISTNHRDSKRLRHLTFAHNLGYSWIGGWEESFSIIATAFSIGVPRHRGSRSIFLPDSKISSGIIGHVRQNKRFTNHKFHTNTRIPNANPPSPSCQNRAPTVTQAMISGRVF
jgi:hypothetical protein